MITNNVFKMFGIPVTHATAWAIELQESLDASVVRADGIDAHLGRGVVAPGIDQIASSAGRLARALGSADSTQNLRS